jgi:hypothetical protein
MRNALVRGLVRLHPPEFRQRFGGEIIRCLADQRRFEGRVQWVPALADLVGSALVQRWKETDMKRSYVIATIVVVLIAVLVSSVVIGTGFSIEMLLSVLAMCAIAGLIAGLASLVSRRNARSAEFDYSQRRLRWWWIPAAVLGGIELFFGISQMIEDPKPENAFALVLYAGFAALVFGGMVVSNRRIGNWMTAGGVLPMLPMIWWYFPPLFALVVIICAVAENIRLSAVPRPA